MKQTEGDLCKKHLIDLGASDCMMVTVSAGRRRMDLHSSNVFADPTLYVGYRDYLSAKRSSHVSFYGLVNERETLSVNARIRMMNRMRTQKTNLNLILSLNQS